MKEIAVAVDDQVGGAVLAPVRAPRLAAEGEVQHAHAVADAEERHRQLEQFSGDLRRVFLIHARRTAGENDSLRPERADFFQRQIERADLTKTLGLAKAGSIWFRVLGPKL